MALACRRKVFCVISRYRLCCRFFSYSSSTSSSSSVPPPPPLPQLPAWKQPQPAIPMHSSLTGPASSACECTSCTSVPSFFTARNYTMPAFFAGKGTTRDAPCCVTHKCTSRCVCRCMTMSGFRSSVRNCTTTAYPPPTPPGEFQGGDEDGEADGAPLNVDEVAAEDGAMPPEDFDMPPFDDPNDAEDDGDYVDEDPPPDPEEALLFSPSDSD